MGGGGIGHPLGTPLLLYDLKASYWAHAVLRINSLMLKGYTVGLDAGL